MNVKHRLYKWTYSNIVHLGTPYTQAEKLWYCSFLNLFHVLDCNAIFANQDLLPTLRPGNFDLHTKMPGSAPA